MNKFLLLFIMSLLISLPAWVQADEIWKLNSLEKIKAYPVELLGNPTIVKSPYGEAISFDGDGDRLLLNANPLGNAKEFTIEAIFKANDVYPNNNEPRFFHIESADSPKRRITLELRLNEKHQWYLDAYIKSENSQFTIIDPTKVHPVGEWFHIAITYKNKVFTSYVNGEQEITGEVEYLPIPKTAQVSVGARINQIHWFNGEILQFRFSKKALKPNAFLLIKRVH